MKYLFFILQGLPPHWDTMSGDTTCVSIPLNAGTPEYSKIQKLFGQSCKKNIIKVDYGFISLRARWMFFSLSKPQTVSLFPSFQIERIQNKHLWKSFEIKKGEMDQRNGHTNNEKQLFHGTNEETIGVINERGFNRSYAGKNGE